MKVIDIQEDLNAGFKNKRSWHTDYSVYGSLFVERSSFDNIIFCDTDLLILGNLNKIFKMIELYDIVATKANSIKSYFNPVAQVPLSRYVTQEGQISIEKYLKTHINWDYVTFNSGFWGVKKDFFIKLKQKYWPVLQTFESDFTFHDQTFLNLACSLENKLYYDIGFGYNAVDVGTTNIWTDCKTFVKYVIYKIKHQNYLIKIKAQGHSEVSYKGNDVFVLHFTGSNKPFFHRRFYGNAIRLWNDYK